MSKQQPLIGLLPSLGLALAIHMAGASSAFALESMDDGDLSGVNAQAGLDISLINPSTTAAISTTKVQSLSGDTANSTNTTVEFQGFLLNGIGTGGVSVGASSSSMVGAYDIKTAFDIGASGTSSAVGLGLYWGKDYGSTFAGTTVNTSLDALRLQMSSLDLLNASNTQSVASNYGSVAFDSSGALRIGNLNGLLSNTPQNVAGDSRQLRLTVGTQQFNTLYTSLVPSYGQLYYSQAPTTAGYGSSTSEVNSELVLDHIYLDTGFTSGTGGVVGTCLAVTGAARCGGSTMFSSGYPTAATGVFNGFNANNNGGIYIGTSHLDFNLAYNVSYRGCSSGTPCTGVYTTNSNTQPLGYLAWGGPINTSTGGVNSGGFNYAELMVGTGGIWTETGVTNYNPDDPSDSGNDCNGAACTPATRNNGVNIGFHGNYDSNFTWYVGQAAGNTTANGPGSRTLAFGAWQTLPGAAWSLSAPNITLAAVNANLGPGGLCWGAQAFGVAASCTGSTTSWINGSQASSTPGAFLNLEPANTALALIVRDLSLQAYSTNVQLLDDKNNNGLLETGEIGTYSWGLVYTLGQFDQNMYIYPGNSANYGATGTAGNGITMDWLLMSQSFGTYPVYSRLCTPGSAGTCAGSAINSLLGNTNFMIADTGYASDGTPACGGLTTGTCSFGIGLLQANLLVGAHLMNLALQSQGIELTSSDVRFEVEGLLGGGPIPSLNYQYMQKIFYTDINMEATKFDMVLKPATTSNGYPYLGFTNRVTLGDTFQTSASKIGVVSNNLNNSPINGGGAYSGAAGGNVNGCAGLNANSSVDCNYLSLGEPSSPTKDFRIADLTGDLNITQGVLGLFSAADTVDSGDSRPRLAFAENIQIGATVGAGALPLTGFVKFGGTALGAAVLPSGSAYMYMGLKPQ